MTHVADTPPPPYTGKDIESATQAVFEVERAHGLAYRSNEIHQRDAVAVLDALAAAGRLLPEGASTDAFTRIHDAAEALQAEVDITPDMQDDPANAGEIEGLWHALRLIDEKRWKVLYEAGGKAEALEMGDDTPPTINEESTDA